MSRLQQLIDPAQGVFAAATGAKPVALLREVALEDRLDHVDNRRLNHPVADCGDPQGPRLVGSWFWNVNTSDWLRLIRAVSQLIRDLPERLWQASFELAHGDVVNPGRAAFRGYLPERREQVPFREDLVKQPEPFAPSHSLFESRQHAHGPGRRFDPSPSRAGLSGLLSQRHYRRSVFGRSGHDASISLEPFAPPALPGFDATTAPLTPARRECPSGPRRSLCVMCRAFAPFRLQPPPRLSHRFDTLPLSVGDIRLMPVWASPLDCGLAAREGRIEFTCVADWRFTSGCFPLRLAATRFPSVTGRRASTWGGLAPP